MKTQNYDIKANALFNGVGHVESLGEYAGEFSQEAYDFLEIDEMGEKGWSDLMITDNGKVYAVASEEEATQFGDFFFKEVEFCDLPKSAKNIVASEMMDEFEDEIDEQLDEIAEEACGGWQGWFVPIWAHIVDGRIEIVAGDCVSRGTSFINSDGEVPSSWVGNFDCWTPYYGKDDAEQWAENCGTDPADFDYETEKSIEIENWDLSELKESIMQSVKEWLLN